MPKKHHFEPIQLSRDLDLDNFMRAPKTGHADRPVPETPPQHEPLDFYERIGRTKAKHNRVRRSRSADAGTKDDQPEDMSASDARAVKIDMENFALESPETTAAVPRFNTPEQRLRDLKQKLLTARTTTAEKLQTAAKRPHLNMPKPAVSKRQLRLTALVGAVIIGVAALFVAALAVFNAMQPTTVQPSAEFQRSKAAYECSVRQYQAAQQHKSFKESSCPSAN